MKLDATAGQLKINFFVSKIITYISGNKKK